VFAVSAVAGEGLKPLIEASWHELSPSRMASGADDDVRFRHSPIAAS
jgi:hypothetical protein